MPSDRQLYGFDQKISCEDSVKWIINGNEIIIKKIFWL